MSWFSLLTGIIGLVRSLATYLHDRALLDAGQAKAVAEAFARASAEVMGALEAGREAEEKAKQGEFDPELFRDDK